MYSNYRYQDDILNQLHFLCTDSEYCWKTATCVLSLVLILSWLLGRWHLEDEDCCDPDSNLQECIFSQIEILSTICSNSEELLKDITANLERFSGGKDNKHVNGYSSQSEDSDISDLFLYNPAHWETLSTQSSGRDSIFFQNSYDPTSGITSSSTSSPGPTGSDFSLSDGDASEHSPLTTISMVAASSKSGLDVNRQRQLWKRAILLVRIVVMLLPERLKPKQERRGVRNICLISDDGPLNSFSDSFYYKRAMFEKYVKMRESLNKQAKPLLPVAQVQTELTQENSENSIITKTDVSLRTHLDKKVTDALTLELKMDDGNYNEKNQRISSELEALESQMKRKWMQHQWVLPKPATQSLNMFMDHQSRHHGDGTKENITAQTSPFCVADQQHDRNSQTLWDAKPVALVENDQSLRLEMANIKDNSSQEGPPKPNSSVMGKRACMETVDGITTLGDISVEMTDKKNCQAITLSQEQTLSVGPVEVLTQVIKSPLKSAGTPDTCILFSTEAKAQGLDKADLQKIAPNLKLKYWEQHMRTPTLYCKLLQIHTPDQSPSKKHLEKETPLLGEGRTLTVKKRIKDMLEFNIKHKLLYQLWGLPLVVQRSLDTDSTNSKMLPKPSEQEIDRTGLARSGM